MIRKILGRIMSARSFVLAIASLATLAVQAFDTPYLTFRSATSFTLSATKRWDGTLQKATSNPTDEASWSDWTGSSISAGLSDGQYYIYLRGKNNTTLNGSSYGALFSFSYGASVYCEGDIEALRDYEGNPPDMAAGCCKYMFSGCSALMSAPALSAMTLANECYFGMFNECSSLTEAPTLPATTLAVDCYRCMFQKCTSLKKIPALPSTAAAASTAERCYFSMFDGCTSLEVNTTGPGVEWSIPEQTASGASSWTYNMFNNTAGSFDGNPVVGTTYYVASALPFGEIYQAGGKGTLDIALAGFPANVDLSSTVKNGTAPYTFALVSGTLPSGMNVSGSTLSGTPTTAGNYSFSLSVTDAESHTLASAAYTMQVVQPTIVATTFVGADGSSITTNCITLTTAMTTLDQAWYVASGTLNYGTGGIKVSGDVNLVLSDGASMTVQGATQKAGVNVASGNSLTIYGQSEGTGALNASNYNSESDGQAGGAGIGGNNNESCGSITINGGTITATGRSGGAGIGGGSNGSGGTIAINGGTVTATGVNYGAGIGGGYLGSGADVTIYGGTVTATAGSSALGYNFAPNGIGQGYNAPSKGTLTVGPTVSVKAGSTANPSEEIGRGGTITIGTQRYFFVENLGLTQVENAFAAYVNEPKSWSLTDTLDGGLPPYSFALKSGSSLPAGLVLDGTTITGKVSVANVYTFTYEVADSSATPLELDATYTLTVTAPDPITVQADLGTVKVGKSKSVTLSDTISGGVPPYTFDFNGAHDAAFTLSAGELTITPSAAQNYTCAITATDALGTAQNITYTVAAVEAAGFTDDDPDEPETGDSVNCLTPDGTFSRTCNQVVNSSSTVTWEDSWYYVTGNVTLSAGAIVKGKVSLILCDNATLTVSGAGYPSYLAGITVTNDYALTIYAQSTGENAGSLVASAQSYSAAIGGGRYKHAGKINIYGGNITATGGFYGAGIGGGQNGNGGNLTIYGGVVNATGYFSPGIGGGNGGNGGAVAVYGGTVNASGGEFSGYPGIGAYGTADQGTLTVGATVTVKAGESATLTDADIQNPNGEINISLANKYHYFYIENTGPKPLVQTTSAFAAYVDDSFEATLAGTVSGGTTPYTFVQKSGTLPTGLSFANGVISGTPTTAGSATVVFTVSDSGTGSDAQSTDFTYTITVTAKPKKITYYNGAVEITGLTPTNYVEGVGATLAATAPAATGYTFAGWYDNSGLTGNAVTTISDVATGDKEFWAKFTPVKYTISYWDGSSLMSGLAPSNYTIEAAATLPATATKAGYGFYGWYGNSGLTGERVYTIPAGSTGNKSFYAKWGVIKTSETYVDGNGDSQSADCVELGSTSTTLSEDWYVVKGNVSISGKVTVSGDVKILLADDAVLTVNNTSYGPAIEVKGSNKLTIYAQSKGNGALNVTASSGPGIGSNDSENPCGTITIYGGDVTVTGNYAGIGGGWNKPGGTVYVYGGNVIANGSSGCAGIGGSGTGYTATGSLTVGENVIVKAKSGSYGSTFVTKPHGAGGAITLGGEQYYKLITPKTVSVSYRDLAGTEQTAPCKIVSEEITALVDGWYAVTDDLNLGTLGMSISGNVNLIIADGASLAVTGANNMAAIHVPSNSSLTVWGQFGGTGAINAVGAYHGAAIGGNDGSSSDTIAGSAGTIVVNGGNIRALGGNYAAGIGGGYYGNCEAVTVNGGTVTAIGGTSGASGIGGGYYGNVAAVTISGGTVTATGGSNGAGVGGGNYGNGAAVAISGGTVTATGGSSAAGIGGGNNGVGGAVTITGGTVTATGGTDGAGIGGGSYANAGGPITISGGTVTATGGSSAAGIGGGSGMGGCDVTVTGGYVVASGGQYATGIGRAASYAAAGTLTVSPTIIVKAGSSPDPTTELTPDANYQITVGSQDRYLVLESTEAQPLSQKSSALAAYAGEATDLPLAGTVQGGIPPYTFAFDGDHPAGVTLSDARTLSVAATVTEGEYTFRLTVTDSDETPRVGTYTYKLTLTTRPTQYSIIYMHGSSQIVGLEPSFYPVGVGTNLPSTNVKNGYSLYGYGWYDNAALEGNVFFSVPADATGDKVFYGDLRPITYRIYYYNPNGTAISGLTPTNYTVESSTIILPTPTPPEGKDFAGWYNNMGLTGSPVTSIPSGSYDTKQFYAKWVDVEVPVEAVPVEFVDADGTAKTTNCVPLAAANAATLSTGWYAVTNSLALDATMEITGNVKLVLCDGVTLTVSGTTYKAGVYVPVSSALTIYAQAAGTGALTATGGTSGAGIGGKMGDSYNTALGSAGTIIINGGVITATGGGNYAAGIGGGSEGSGGNVTVNRGLVTANGGANSYGIGAGAWGAANGTLRVGSTMLVKAGSTTNPQDRLDIDSETGLVTVSAMLQYFVVKTAEGEAPEWAITYMDGEEAITTLSPKKYIEGIGVAELPAVPAKAGYTADGWYGNAGLTGDAVTSISSSATGAQTLWAKYTPIAYSITYKDGATTMTDLAPATYTAVASAVLPTPTPPEGKVFSGWYTNSTFTGSAVTAIPAGSTGDKTFYAKWNFQKSVEDYIDEEGNPASTNCLVVTSSTTTLDDSDGGWYIVKDDVSFSSTLTISGDVNLILADGATLTVTQSASNMAGIGLEAGNTLTIYAQSTGTGAIVATGGSTGIGGNWDKAGGSLAVYGGSVTAYTGYNSRGGIGGSYTHASEGSLKVGPYARVTVKANDYGASVVKKEVAPDGTVALESERYYWIVFDKVATVSYRDIDGMDKEQVCKFVSSENLDLDDGWYAVTNDLNLGVSGITVAGSVNLIIADGASLVVTGASDKAGINVPTNCTLTIYGQAAGTGAISATGGSWGAGIGGSSGDNGDSTRLMGAAGTIVINGCDIVAQGGSGSAGIGGGSYGNGGTVTVNGGTVTAHGGNSNMGIGKGMSGTDNGKLYTAATRSVMAGNYLYNVDWYDMTTLSRDSATGEIEFPSSTKYYFTIGPVPAAVYTITYYNWHGDEYGWITVNYSLDQSAAKTYVEGIGATLPDNVGSVTKSGYVFGGWYADTALTEGPVTAIPADATGDKSFYLKWTPVAYSITYMDMDKVTPILGLVPSTYVLTNEYVTLPSPPLKNGYTFNGWYSDYELTQVANWIPSYTSGDRTFYGKWTPTTYTITYMDGDDTISGLVPTNFTIVSSDVILPTAGPEKEGYTFAGWTLDSAGAGETVTTVPSGSYGDKTYYAKWTPNAYPITYMDGATPIAGLLPTNYTAAAGAQLPAATKPGSFFVGWYTNSTFTGSAVTAIPAGQTGAKTFYAKWSGNTSVTFVDADGIEVSETCAEVAQSMTTWNSGWYVVNADTAFDSSVTVSGDVKLVLADDVTLTVAGSAYGKPGILVPWGHSLTIYGQQKGTGALIASGYSAGAGIGGCKDVDCGTVTVNGGVVTARGGSGAAGVGGGYLADGGDVFLNGGVVTAYGGGNAPGIGAGTGKDDLSQGSLTLGDNVILEVSQYLDHDDPTKPRNPETVCVGGEVELYGDMRYFRAEKSVQASPSTYLAFTSAEPFTVSVENPMWDGELRYSTDTMNWILWDGSLLEAAEVEEGYALYFRGAGNTRITSSPPETYWTIDGVDVSCTGDIETLRGYDGNAPAMANYCYYGMFNGCSALVSAPTLSCTSLSQSCYAFMFQDCTSLTNVPALPATYLGTGCYNHMFDGCTSLRISESGPGTEWSLPDEVRTSYNIQNSYMFKDTSGSFKGSPTNSVYYIKGANDLDVPIRIVEHIYATASAIDIDFRDTLSGGSGNLTFEATTDLPEGLSLDAGVLSGALAPGHTYPLGIRVTDGWFGKSVDLSYTLHAVATIPELSQTAQALGPYSAYILADTSLTNTISGYVGACRFVETPGSENKVPTEIQLVEDGRLYINGELDAGTYTFDLTVTDGALRAINCTYVLTIAANEPAVIDSVTPSDDVVTVYGGESVTFTVAAHDPEGQSMTYYWYLDGAILGGVGGIGPSYTYSYMPLPDGSVEKPTRTLKCSVWDRHSKVTAKLWTINNPGWRYEITTGALPAATTGEDYNMQFEGVGRGGDVEWYLADGDRLPPGLAMGVDGVITGSARMAGSYTFMVLREEGGSIVSKEFTLEVTGANAAVTTFGPLVDDIGLQMVVGQTIPGDTIVFADGAEISTLDANDFPGVTFSVPAGTVTLVTDVEAPLDAQNLVVAAGAQVVFKAVAARPYFGHYDIVKMPTTMAGTWSVDAPFFLAAAPVVDSEGMLGFDALGGKGTDDTLTVLIPDGPDVREHELAGFATTGGLVYHDESSVDGVSVLGSTLTLSGDNSFGGGVSQTEANTAIVLDQGASLDIGSIYELGGSLVFEEGSSFKFGAQTDSAVVSNAVFGGSVVPPSSGTASLVLKDALEDGESVTVFDYYTGSAESFQLVLPDGVDATHYSLVCEDGCLVVKCGAPLHEDDPGTMTVTGGDSFNMTFGDSSSGNMVTAGGGTAPYTWTCPLATYAITRAGNSFDGSSGAAELAIRQRLGQASSLQRNVIGLGFDFPFGGYLQNQVAVGLNGCITVKRGNGETGRICLFGVDATDFVTANEIFVSRSATTATIRFGQRVSVTFVSDGTIRVAYGPLAEGAQRRYMPCDIEISDRYLNFVRVARFEAENGVYNGIGDVVFTQTSAVPGGLSPSSYGSGIGLSGVLSAPAGSYPVKFCCIDANGYVIEKNVTVNVGDANSSLIKSTATAPAAEADGTCHVQYGESQTFSVAGIDPSMCRWYEDNTKKAEGVLSYTFDSSTGPWPVLSTSVFDFDKHTKLITCRVLDPLYGGKELTVASWQVVVNVTYHIDASVVDDAADGSEAHPFRTIPTELSGRPLTTGAFPGDVFLFRPGKYKLPFEAPDDFAVTLRSTDGAGVTLITVNDADKAAFVQKGAGGASRAATVEGFTLVNAGGRAAYGGTLVNCVLCDSALAANHGVSDDDLGYGGGAYGSRLVNCLVSNCSAVYGGGVANCELRNCTVVCNYADELGGALDGASVAYNTVFWGNGAGSDDHDSDPTERTPVPGYILPRAPTIYGCLYAEDPMLYADGRPAVGSPCIGAGNAAYLATDVNGALTDLAGDTRNAGGSVSIGAYENAAEKGECRIMVKATGAGTVLEAPYADVEYGKDATFRFRGRLAAVVCTNGVMAAENVSSYVWPAVTQPGELSVTFTATDLYVDVNNGSFGNDGLSWDSPKYSISDAISSAGDGDVIHVKPGRYGSVMVSLLNKLTNLRIVSTEGRDVTVIDAQHIGSCFDVSLDYIKNTEWERHGIVLEGFTLQNGRATGYLGGGGACGGTLKNCIIQNCESIGRYTTTDTARGGGTSGSALINCIVRDCRAGKSVSDGTWYSNAAEGGGVWGGSAEKCEIYGNSCWGTTRSVGPGTYETILRDCYVYNNKIGTLQEREAVIPAADAALNTAGDAVEIRVTTREPTTVERNDTTDRIVVGDSREYASEAAAVAAKAGQKPDITLEIASKVAPDKIDTYTEMFEIKTVQNETTGAWENRPELKASVVEELREDLTDAMSTLVTAESLTELGTGVTEFTLEDPKPGLYYAMEFCETLGGGAAFTGPRYLSNGHSVKLSVEHHDTPSGFWRMSVYKTPTGE